MTVYGFLCRVNQRGFEVLATRREMAQLQLDHIASISRAARLGTRGSDEVLATRREMAQLQLAHIAASSRAACLGASPIVEPRTLQAAALRGLVTVEQGGLFSGRACLRLTYQRMLSGSLDLDELDYHLFAAQGQFRRGELTRHQYLTLREVAAVYKAAARGR